MSRPRITVLLFAVVCTAQLAAPLSMIWRHERTLRTGTAFKVQTEPVDPVDAFRGRYVAVSPFVEVVEAPAEPLYGEVWVELETGPDGFARARRATAKRPDGPTAIRGTMSPPREQSGGPARVLLGLDRYYMEESKAPAVEHEYAGRARRGAGRAWLVIRVRDGMAAIEALYLDGNRAEDVLARPQ